MYLTICRSCSYEYQGDERDSTEEEDKLEKENTMRIGLSRIKSECVSDNEDGYTKEGESSPSKTRKEIKLELTFMAPAIKNPKSCSVGLSNIAQTALRKAITHHCLLNSEVPDKIATGKWVVCVLYAKNCTYVWVYACKNVWFYVRAHYNKLEELLGL